MKIILYISIILIVFQYAEGGLFSTKKRSCIDNINSGALPALPLPELNCRSSSLTVTDNLNDIEILLANMFLMEIFITSWLRRFRSQKSMERFYVSYWIDSNVSSGLLQVLIVSKQNNVVNITEGVAKLSIPEVYRTWTECTKKKKWYGKTKTNCWDHKEKRGLTVEELNFIVRHLENSIKSNAELAKAISKAEENYIEL